MHHQLPGSTLLCAPPIGNGIREWLLCTPAATLHATQCLLPGLTPVHAPLVLWVDVQVGQTHRSTRTLGTVSHMAPELLRLGRMSSAADVYAFSIMSECCAWSWVLVH
jgi:serine/threonine protein kinase